MDKYTHTLVHTHIHKGILFSLKKGNSDNMDKPQEHYSKGNKLDIERYILHDFTDMWYLKSHKSRVDGGCQRLKGGEK